MNSTAIWDYPSQRIIPNFTPRWYNKATCPSCARNDCHLGTLQLYLERPVSHTMRFQHSGGEALHKNGLEVGIGHARNNLNKNVIWCELVRSYLQSTAIQYVL